MKKVCMERLSMNKRKYFKTTCIHLSIMVIFILGIVGIIYSQGYVYGSTTDWINQHSILPNYFRQYFYDTGSLFPKFNMNLGAGQNGYNISYYGLLNPIVLFSYLFPWIKMTDYVVISSIGVVIAAAFLFYYWMIKRKTRQDIAFVCTILFTCAGPLIFHSHKQIMFIQYMPFLIMALIGVDRFFEKKKAKLLIISTVLVILTNYYFSIGAIIAITIYAVYRFLERCYQRNVKITIKDFIINALQYAGCIITAVLMSAILLIPTFIALLNGRDKNPQGKGVALDILIPDIDINSIMYTAYGVGVTAVVVIAIISMFKSKQYPKIYLGAVLVIVMMFPAIKYALNAGLYTRSKCLIPLVPVFVLAVSFLLSDLVKNKIIIKIYLVSLPIILIAFFLFNGMCQSMLIFTVDLAVTAVALYISIRTKKPVITYAVTAVVAVVVCVVANMQDDLLTKEYAEILGNEDRKELIEETLAIDNSFYRMNNLDDAEYTSNMNFGINYHQTSMYSSVYNSYYNELIHDTLQLANPTINKISSVNAPNVVFQTFMGIKYIDTRTINMPVGYTQVAKKGEYTLCENKNAYSLGFATNKTMSEEEFLGLEPIDRQVALLEYIIAKDGQTTDYDSKYEKLDVDIDFGEEFYKDGRYYINLAEKKNLQVDLKEYDYDIYSVNIFFEKVETNNAFIYINGTRNALSGKYAAFPNENLYFSYTLSSNEKLDKLDVSISKGHYVITGYEVYGMNYSEITSLKANMDMMENIKVEDEVITGSINVSKDGYLNLTIPYDEAFTLYIDNKETKIEMTDTAFMGCVISKGNHNIKLVYQVPGYKVSIIISVIGCLIFAGIICFDLKASLNRQGKKHN